MTRDDLRAALSHPNVAAFIRGVRQGESRQDDLAYRMRFGGHGKPPAYFDSFADHPRIFEPTADGRRSSAAGAPQATATTWDEEREKWGWPDFSPPCQDEFFVARFIYPKALPAIMAGRFDEACHLCRLDWTSLPGGQEQNAATASARETYVKWGGKFEAVEEPAAAPAPEPAFNPDTLETEHYDSTQEATTMPAPLVAPLLIGLASSLIDAFTPLAREKFTKTLARHTDQPEVAAQVAGALVDAAKKVTGKADALAAVAAARESPPALQQVEDEALVAIEKLAPVLDRMAEWDSAAWRAEESSRDAATQRAGVERVDRFFYFSVVVIVEYCR